MSPLEEWPVIAIDLSNIDRGRRFLLPFPDSSLRDGDRFPFSNEKKERKKKG